MTTECLPPRLAIARWMPRAGVGYWMSGYEIFDPEHPHSHRNGLTKLNVQRPPAGYVWLICAGQVGRPVAIPKRDVRPAAEVRAFSFDEIFNTKTAIAVEGAR